MHLLRAAVLLFTISVAFGNEALAEGILDVVEPVINASYAELAALVKILAQANSWQQQINMERNRMEGDSGLMQVRSILAGTKPWVTNQWARRNGQAAIHNHADNIRTVGMGEFVAVMNGVQFRTRHNDYRLNQASRTSTEYGAYEPVEFPPIPPSVEALAGNLTAQVIEMREYFRAWAEQKTSIRNYKPYFKPVLTYMEGMWTIPEENTIDEPFFSDRHSINADNWFELQEEIQYNTLTGTKDIGENLAILPTMIYNVTPKGLPLMAQWNYKILTHPIEKEVPLSRFRVVDDVAVMMRNFKDLNQLKETRNARFQLNPDTYDNYDYAWGPEDEIGYENFLEEIMHEIPGLDNYPADLTDSFFDEQPYTLPNEQPLNAGYYHRYYSQLDEDASGVTQAARGFADANLFVALNTQQKIMPVTRKECNRRGKNCKYQTQRVSYAIPLEVVYLTPLNTWNPYHINYSENNDDPVSENEAALRRNGFTPARAYNGSSSKYYYLTPTAMFHGNEVNSDAADTVRDSVHILDKDGEVRKTVASGVRIFLPEIDGIGTLRTRYPIFNVHQEGSAIYKELAALKDMVRHGATYAHLYDNPLGGLNTDVTTGLERFTFSLRTVTTSFGPHSHTFELTADDINKLKANPFVERIEVTTAIQANHNHRLQVQARKQNSKYRIFVTECDGNASDMLDNQSNCPDGHPSRTDCIDCPFGLIDP